MAAKLSEGNQLKQQINISITLVMDSQKLRLKVMGGKILFFEKLLG